MLEGVIDTRLCRRCQSSDELNEDLICIPCVSGDLPTILAAVTVAGRAAHASGNEARVDFLRATYNRLRQCRPGPVVFKDPPDRKQRVTPATLAPVIESRGNACLYQGKDAQCVGTVRPYPSGRRCDNHRPQSEQFDYAQPHAADKQRDPAPAPEIAGPGPADS